MSRVRVKESLTFLQRALHTGAQIFGVQAVQKKKATDQFVVATLLDQVFPGLAAFCSKFENAFQTGSVQGHNGFEQLERQRTQIRIGAGFHLPDERRDALNLLFSLRLLRHKSFRSTAYVRLHCLASDPPHPIA